MESVEPGTGFLAISGICGMLDLVLLCEHVLAKRPYLSDSEDGGCRAQKKLITLVERVKDHLWHATGFMANKPREETTRVIRRTPMGTK